MTYLLFGFLETICNIDKSALILNVFFWLITRYLISVDNLYQRYSSHLSPFITAAFNYEAASLFTNLAVKSSRSLASAIVGLLFVIFFNNTQGCRQRATLVL